MKYTEPVDPADDSSRHLFWDHQHCLKCGKWEVAPDANDCVMSDRDYEALVRAGEQPAWRKKAVETP